MSPTKIICPSCDGTNSPKASRCIHCGIILPSISSQGSAVATDLSRGSLLHGRYRILRPIGEGGMARVYKAEDIKLGQRLVAVKAMDLPDLRTKDDLYAATQAFEREAHLLAKLNHPYLPSMYDHFNDHAHWYLVMEYIQGTTLDGHLWKMPGRRLPPEQALTIGRKLCDVLGYLHTQKPPIVFGDLKPSNIMRTPTSDIYLIDFGIARPFKITQANGILVVSRGYSPPEQYQSIRISPRADIYSLGATLHHLLSGQHPSSTDFHFAPLQLGNYLWANDLQILLTSMLEQDIQKRPENVMVIKQKLDRIAADRVQEQGNSIPLGSPIWTQSWDAQAQAPVVPSVIISSPPPSVTHRDVKLSLDFVYTLAWSPDGSLFAVGSVSSQGKIAKDQQQPKVQIYALPSEKNLLPSISESLVELRSWSLNWNTHTEKRDSDTYTYMVSGIEDSTLVWSPDGTQLAFTDREGDNSIFCILNINSGRSSVAFLQETRGIHAIKWSPDGKLIATITHDNSILQIWNAEQEIKLSTYDDRGNRIYKVAWSPDSRSIAFARDIGTIFVMEVMTGREICRYHQDHTELVQDIAWSPDGSYIVSCGEDLTIHIWDAHTAHHLRSLEGHTDRIARIAFLSNGLLFVSIAYSGQAFIWRTDTWLQVESFNTSSYSGLPILHPMGALLVRQGDGIDRLRIWELDVELLLGQPAKVYGLQYTNAKVVLVGDSGVGKSGLRLVLLGEPYVPTESTHGRLVRTFSRRERPLDGGGKEIREILLWDLAGQAGYRLIHQLHLNVVAVALVVFDAHSETDPFAGIAHWVRGLRTSQRVGGNRWTLKMLLIHGRADRGGKRVSRGRIDELVSTLGFDAYFETSAKEGTNIAELHEAISQIIEWDQLPKVSSTELFQRIKRFLIEEKETGHLLSIKDDLYRTFRHAWVPHYERGDMSQEFGAGIRLLETAGLIRQLKFGNLVLLQPELLDAYASALIHAVRDEPDGLGCILEEHVRTANFFISSDERISDSEQEKLLLIAMVEDLLSHDIALREQSTDGAYLIFPSETTRENPSLPDPENRSVVLTFEGPVLNIYATLAVRLCHTELFTKQELWKNAITYRARIGGTCGIFLHIIEDGKGELTLFFDRDASEETRFHFEEYVHTHLQRKALQESIQRRRIFTCEGCGFLVSDQLVQLLAKQGKNDFQCIVCKSHVFLIDREERLKAAMPSRVPEMDRAADGERNRATAKLTIQGKQKTNDFDVFLCYNKANRDAVISIGEQLKEKGFLPWLDEWEARPGYLWQTQLEKQIQQVKSAAVFIGADGLGPWQEIEVRALLNQFVDRGCPVIPVMLDNAPKKPELPLFLKQMMWVDFREPEPDPFKRLIWGITDKKPPL